MCFFIHKNHTKEKIAKKDIVCYKRLIKYENGFFSPYMATHYNLNKLYKSKLKGQFFCNRNVIETGLHSYSYKKEAKSWLRKPYEILAKGIIPKGSKYYYNPTLHEYVSNQIILQEVIR